MKNLFKVKRKCAVPGCASIDSYSLSKGSGGAVCLCAECIRELDAFSRADKKQRKKKGTETARGDSVVGG